MNIRLEVHHLYPADHVTDVCCFRSATGEEAKATAAEILSRRGDAYGELSVDDSTGAWRFYDNVTTGGAR